MRSIKFNWSIVFVVLLVLMIIFETWRLFTISMNKGWLSIVLNTLLILLNFLVLNLEIRKLKNN